MRRMFDLIDEDIEFLNGKGLAWETVVENGAQWVIVKNHPLPEGFNHNQIELAINLLPGYPVTPLDMVYCYPHLNMKNGKPIPAIASHMLDNKEWQRWSRHRTAANPWRVGEDNIGSHLTLAEEWFLREIRKN